LLDVVTDVRQFILAASIAISVVCLLIFVFMFISDRALEQPDGSKRVRSATASFALGIGLLVWAGVLLGIALDAERQGGLISPTYHSGWMTPRQGYAAAILILLAGLYSIVLAWRTARERRDATRDI